MKNLPLKWHGGKQYLAKKILALFPPRDSYLHYVEPFFGGGAVLFHHDPEGKSEVANDLNGELANFWNVLRGPEFDLFQRLAEATPMSEDEWKNAVNPTRPRLGGADVDAAMWFFILYRQSRQALAKDFATLSRNRTRRGMNEQASSWLSAVDGLRDAHARLRRVVILNRDAIEVIKQQDGPQTVFYCDPPYLHETRSVTDAYENEMTLAQHENLLAALAHIGGRFLLSGYPSTTYNVVAEHYGWNRVDIEIDNKSSGSKVKEIKTECVWMNY
jgi:DNA adenine methylase